MRAAVFEAYIKPCISVPYRVLTADNGELLTSFHTLTCLLHAMHALVLVLKLYSFLITRDDDRVPLPLKPTSYKVGAKTYCD